MTCLPHAGNNPNFLIRDSPAHKFKTLLLCYLNSRAETEERQGKQCWNSPLWAGIPRWVAQRAPELNTPLAASSASQTGSNCCGLWHLRGSMRITTEVPSFWLGLHFFLLVQVAAHSALERRLHIVFLFILCLVKVLGLLGRRLLGQGGEALFFFFF